jgi:rfaE bifunctional protein nucleotidyltransferase chain/domain
MIFQDIKHLGDWRLWLPKDKTLVVTNGCFDIIHVGHVNYLQRARALGDLLLVGVNDDDSVRKMKGDGRPINPLQARMEMIDSLKSVDIVAPIFSVNCSEFLEHVRPVIYTKGGDYRIDTLNKEEKSVLDMFGTRIYILKFVEGFSTTSIINKVKQ